MGGNEVTVKNLQIIDIHAEQNLIIVKGSIPGKPGSIISIKENKDMTNQVEVKYDILISGWNN